MKILDASTEITAAVVRRDHIWEIRVLNPYGDLRYEFQWNNAQLDSLNQLRLEFKKINGFIPAGGTILAFCRYLSTCTDVPPIVNVYELRMSLL